MLKSELLQQNITGCKCSVSRDIYLFPNDFGEFLLVLKNGPDEESLQGVPGNGRRVLGGIRACGHHVQMEVALGALL